MEIQIHHAPTRLIAGVDCLNQLTDEVSHYSRRCLVVTGRRAMRLSGLLDRVLEALNAARVEPVVFDQVEPNPSIDTIVDGTNLARAERVRWVLGLGGGSALDAAKAIALMTVNDGDLRHFFKGMKPENSPLPIVAIPTTSGTGSEVTPYSVISDAAEGDKFGLAMPELFPKLSFLDPMVTLTAPEVVTVDTGLDAMSHAVEALLSAKRTVFSDMYAKAALQRIAVHLPLVRADLQNLEARAQLQLAAAFAGLAIADSATLAPHAMSYPITVRYDLPHGRACALIQPAFLEQVLKEDSHAEVVAQIGAIFGDQQDAPAALRNFVESLGVAPKLGAYGVNDQDLEGFCRQVKDKKHLAITPGQWTEESIAEVYRRSL